MPLVDRVVADGLAVRWLEIAQTFRLCLAEHLAACARDVGVVLDRGPTTSKWSPQQAISRPS